MRIGIIVVAAMLGGLVGCTSPAELAAAKFAPEKSKYEPNVGKDHWVHGLAELCKGPALLPSDCTPLPINTHLKIDDVVQGYIKTGTSVYYEDDAYYHVVLDDGTSGYTNALILSSAASEADPAIAVAECKRRGEPRIGMTAAQVEATCWGTPDHVNTRQTAQGIRKQFVYANNRHVDLHNGFVTSIDIGGLRQSRSGPRSGPRLGPRPEAKSASF